MVASCTVVSRCFERRSSSGSNASLIRSRQYLDEPKQINNSNIVAMTKFDSISCLPPGRALWIHVQTLRSRWHNSCHPVPSPFQLLWKAVMFHTLCVLLVHPSSLTSPHTNISTITRIVQNLTGIWEGSEKNLPFLDQNHGFPLRTAVV